MLLIGVRKDDGWQHARWELTYPAGWVNICNGVAEVFESFEDTEILIAQDMESGKQSVNIQSKDEIAGISESSLMTIRGMSKVFELPLTMTFYNQTKIVDIAIPADGKEFAETNYEKFNHSFCAFMDSIELYMHGL